MEYSVKKKLIHELEKECERLHNATRTDIPFLSPVHNLLRSKLPFYYDWSTSVKTPTIHRVGVLGFLASFLFFSILQFAIPNLFVSEVKKVKAQPVEIASKRQESLKVFQLSEKEFSAQIFASPVQYKDSNGNWQSIDVNLENPQGGQLKITKAPYNLDFDKNAKQPLIFKVGGNQVVVHQDVSINNSQAVVSKNVAFYPNVYPKTDLERIAMAEGVKQHFILKEPGHQSSFVEKISGNTQVSINNGSIIFKNNQGQVVAKSPKPEIIDAKGQTTFGSFSLLGDNLTLSLPDLSGFSYPIKVDPSFTHGTAEFSSATAFNVNNTVNPVVLGDMGGGVYYESGNLTSQYVDLGAISKIDSVAWDNDADGVNAYSQPANTTIKLQMAVNNDNATWNFVGPDGTANTYFTNGQATNMAGRYVKYKAFFSDDWTAQTATGIPAATTDHIYESLVKQLPDGKYRLYYRYQTSNYGQLAYRDTTDTNPPNSASTNLGAQVLMFSGASASDQSGAPTIIQLPDSKYRMYYPAYSANGWRLVYRDTTDTNLPNSSNLGSVVELSIGGTSTNQTFGPWLEQLSDSKYRLYYSYHNGTYWQLVYKDTTDTNLPISSNLGAQVLMGVGSSASDQAIRAMVWRMPDNKYRMYYGGYGTYWGTYYRDTTDTNLPNNTNLGSAVFTGLGTASNSAFYPTLTQTATGKYRLHYSYNNGTNWQLAYKDIDRSVSPALYSITVNHTVAVTGDEPGGDLVVDGGTGFTYTITGDKQGVNGYKSITVKGGSILNIQPNDTTDGSVIDVNYTGGTGKVWVTGNSKIIPIGFGSSPNGKGATLNAVDVQIDAGSSIDASGKGYAAGAGPGAGGTISYTTTCYDYYNNPYSCTQTATSGGGYGGNGGGATNTYDADKAGTPTNLGSGGGGGGGTGGGAIKIIASGTLTNNGSILANGIDATGAGSGGSIWLDSNVLAGNGTVSLKGGNGGASGGGGGRMAVYYNTNSYSGSINANGGTGTTYAGGTGTIVFQGKSSSAINAFSNQSKLDAITPLKTGQSTSETGIILNFWYKAESGANYSVFTPEIEYKPIDTPFDGSTNVITGSLASINGTLARGSVTIPSGNLISGTQYHWRVRIKNGNNNYGSWMAYQNAMDSNNDGSKDGTVDPNQAVSLTNLAVADFEAGGSSVGSNYPDLSLTSNISFVQTGQKVYQGLFSLSSGVGLSLPASTFWVNNSDVTISGSSLSASSGSSFTVNNLTVSSGSLSIGGSLITNGNLTLSSTPTTVTGSLTVNDNLILSNNTLTLGQNSSLTVTGNFDLGTSSSATLDAGGGSVTNVTGTLNVGTSTITSTIIARGKNTSADSGGVGITINAGNVVISNSNSKIDGTALGYDIGYGPGKGGSCSEFYGSSSGGAGYGANGGGCYGGGGAGVAYDDALKYAPTNLGSSSVSFTGNNGYGDGVGGRGGSAIKLVVSGNLVNNGQIIANGSNGTSGGQFKNSGGGPFRYYLNAGGGSGGSIWVKVTGSLSGAGTILANGGSGVSPGGNGGGGRIALYYGSKTYTGSITASGANTGSVIEQGSLSVQSFSNMSLGSTPYKTGAWINQINSNLNFWALTGRSGSTNINAIFTPAVEVRPINQSFDDTGFGDSSVAGVYFVSSAVNTSESVYRSTVSLSGLSNNTQYHWRVRIKNAGGAWGGWTSYGNNMDGETDFGINTALPGVEGGTEYPTMTVDRNISNSQSSLTIYQKDINYIGSYSLNLGNSVSLNIDSISDLSSGRSFVMGSSTIFNCASNININGGALVFGANPNYSVPLFTVSGGSVSFGDYSNQTTIDFNKFNLNNGNLTFGANTYLNRTTNITIGSAGTATLTIGGNSTLKNTGDLTVGTGVSGNISKIIAKGYGVSPNGRGVIFEVNNLTVNAYASIDASGQGYAAASGPGAGGTVSYTTTCYDYYNNPYSCTITRSSGGGYGGNGGGAANSYDDNKKAVPTNLGSGGGNTGATGGSGGGAIKIVATGNLTNSGSILANGSNGGGAGGGGGSIWLDIGVLAGNGTISAKGGNASGEYGGGGGGRIALYYGDKTSWSGTALNASGIVPAGTGTSLFSAATAGSAYIPPPKPYNINHSHPSSDSLLWTWSQSESVDSFKVITGSHLDDGSSSGVGANYLDDTTKGWTANQYTGKILIDSVGNTFNISGNTATRLNLSSGTPASGPYQVEGGAVAGTVTGGAAGNYSWTQNGLNTNTQYTVHIHAVAGGAWSKNSNIVSAYTEIQSPGNVVVDTVGTTSVTVSPSVAIFGNLSIGSSGIIYEIYDINSQILTGSGKTSGWLQADPNMGGPFKYTFTDLDPNTTYKFKIKTRNGDGEEKATSLTSGTVTLSIAPTVDNIAASLVPNPDPNPWYSTLNIQFTNNIQKPSNPTDVGFGMGKIEKIKYILDNNFADPENFSVANLWNSSVGNVLSINAPSSGQWYLHIEGYNSADIVNGKLTLGIFRLDNEAPDTPQINSYKNSSQGQSLASGVWYNFNTTGAEPYFSWSSADKPLAPPAAGNAGIDKYYVYFGTQNPADPGDAGFAATNLVIPDEGDNIFGPTELSYTPKSDLSTNIYYLKIKAVDKAGNSSSVSSFTYNYDEDPPNFSMAGLDKKIGGTKSLISGNWYNFLNPYFTFTSSGEASGVDSYAVYFGASSTADPSNWYGANPDQTGNYEALDTLSSGTDYYLRVKAKDKAGNISSIQQFIYRFDSSNPNNFTISGFNNNIDKVVLETADSNKWWYNSNTPGSSPYFEWSASDTPGGYNAGIAGYHIYFGLNNGTDPVNAAGDSTNKASVAGNNFYPKTDPKNEFIPPVELTTGTYYLIIKAKDNADNLSSAQTYIYHFDKDGPSNVSTVWAKSSTTGNSLISDQPYNYTNPYFYWNASNDGSGDVSGIAGYAVYFGANNNADPANSSYNVSNLAYANDTNLYSDTNFTSPTLTLNTTYYLRVKAKDKAGNYSTQKEFIYKFDDTPPSNISIQGKVSATDSTTLFSNAWYSYFTASQSPYLYWDSSSDVNGISNYAIYFGENANADPANPTDVNVSTNFAYVDNDPDNSHYPSSQSYYAPISSLSTNKTYYLRIKAKDNAGNYASSASEFIYKLDNEASSAMANFRQTGKTDNGITVAWDASTDNGSGLAGYVLERVRADKGWPTQQNPNPLTYQTFNLSSGVTSKTDTALDPGYKYLYRIKAKDSSTPPNFTAYSQIDGYTADAIPPTIPTDVKAYACGSKPTAIKYDYPAGAGDLEVNDASGLPASGIYLMIDNEYIGYSSIQGNILKGITRGVLGSSTADHSAGAKVQIICQGTQDLGFTVMLTWTPSADDGTGVTGYKIYRRAESNSTNQGDFTVVGYLDVPTPGLPISTVYYDNDTKNDSIYSDTLDGVLTTVKGNASTRLNDYVDYHYRIVAVDAGGNTTDVITVNEDGIPNTADDLLSNYKNYATTKTVDVTKPTTPNIQSVTAMGVDEFENDPLTQRVDISWEQSKDLRATGRTPEGNGSGLKEYRLYRAKGNETGPTESFTQIVTSTDLFYADKGLTEFTYYYYKVQSIDNSSILSDETGIVSTRTATSSVPTTPTQVNISSTKGDPRQDANIGKEISVSFYGSTIKFPTNKITGYEVYRSETNYSNVSDWFDQAKATKVKTYDNLDISGDTQDQGDNGDGKRSFKDTVSKDAKSYYYRIRTIAFNLDTNQVIYSNLSGINATVLNGGWDTTPDITPPDIPSDVKVKDIHGDGVDYVRVIVTWKRVSDPLRNNTNDFKEYRLYRSEDGVIFNQILANGQNPLIKSTKNESLATNYYVDAIPVADSNKDFYYYVTSTDNAGEEFKYSSGQIINDKNNESGKSTIQSLNPGQASANILTLDNTKKSKILSSGVSSAKIYWETDQLSDSLVLYKLKDSSEDYRGAYDGRMVINHEIELQALERGKIYDYKIISRNSLKNDTEVASNFAGVNQLQELRTQDFSITDISVATTTTTATVIWNTNIESDSQIEYKLQKDPGEVEEASQTAGAPGVSKKHEVIIKALKPARTYTYKVRSITSDKYVSETEFKTFQTKPFDSSQFVIAPDASRISEQNITSTSAKITWATEVPTTSWVEYGTETGKYILSAGSNDLTKSHVVEIMNLTPNILYYYRVKGTDQYDIEYVSQEYTFRALAKPEVSNVLVREVAPYNATITWNTNIPTDSGISYGTSINYDKREQSKDLKISHELSLQKLTDQTTYHFIVEVKDAYGNIAKSEDKVFSTPLDTQGPKISEVKLSPLTGSDVNKRGVIITWITDKEATTQAEYGTGVTPGKYEKKSPVDPTYNVSHTVILSDLEPGTSYHFRLISKDKRGNEGKSQDYTMLTSEKEESILNLILKTLEDTFSWVGKVKDFVGTQFSKLLGK